MRNYNQTIKRNVRSSRLKNFLMTYITLIQPMFPQARNEQIDASGILTCLSLQVARPSQSLRPNDQIEQRINRLTAAGTVTDFNRVPLRIAAKLHYFLKFHKFYLQFPKKSLPLQRKTPKRPSGGTQHRLDFLPLFRFRQ